MDDIVINRITGKDMDSVIVSNGYLQFYYNLHLSSIKNVDGGGIDGIFEIRGESGITYVPYRHDGLSCYLGTWLIPCGKKNLEQIIKKIFASSRVLRIYIQFASSNPFDCLSKEIHWKLDLTDGKKLLERGTSKSRYNLRRSLRLLEEEHGNVQVSEIACDENMENASEYMDVFFLWKQNTHNRDYKKSGKEYISSRGVTHMYMMWAGETKCAVALTNEAMNRCSLVNISYNMDLSRFSPGMLLYEKVIERLIDKHKTFLYLGGGEKYDYKKKYGAIREETYTGWIYRNGLVERLILICKKVL